MDCTLTSVLGWTTISLIVFSIYKLITKNQDYWTKHGIKTVNQENVFVRLFAIKRSFVDFDLRLYQQTKGCETSGYVELTYPILYVSDLELVKQVCIKDFDHFVDRRRFNTDDAHWNLMLMNMESQAWKDLRATMSPTFTTGKIRRMFPILKQSSDKLADYLKEKLKDSDVIDFEELLGKYALDVIASVAFGLESNTFKDTDSIFLTMSKRLQTGLNLKNMISLLISFFIPTASKFFGWSVLDAQADDFFSQVITRTIENREKSGEKRDDFLQLMIDTKNGRLQVDKEAEMDVYEKDAQLKEHQKISNKSKVEITNDLIIANCLIFFIAGFDSLQSALMFATYALAINPDIQEKLVREIENAVEKNGELDYDILNQIKYLEMFTNETLRMYPPAFRAERRCTKEFPLPGTSGTVPVDGLVNIPIYRIHHDAEYYPEPEKFDPERFSPEIKNQRHPYAYIPFGTGPRNCIASRFAIIEIKAAIAHLVMNFKIEPSNKTSIPMKYKTASTLKPSNGMWLKFAPRNSN